MTDDELRKLEIEFAKEFKKRLEMMLYSELSLFFMQREIEKKPIEIEYQQDYVFYMNRYWFSMPYPKGSFLGFVITSS